MVGYTYGRILAKTCYKKIASKWTKTRFLFPHKAKQNSIKSISI